ncbi:MAG: hypothetical protein D6744_03540 [Planctomycetota bacterium]|nr:MAG: hypothetical protein D6744_03540 [Planctomycetota bacterium]
MRTHSNRLTRWAAGILGVGALLACAGGCPAPSGAEFPQGATIGLQKVADGFTAPVALAWPDDGSGRIFIVSQIGLIHIIDANGALRSTPFLDLRDRIVELSESYDERGLLGLAFHPQYADNGRFFVYYTAPASDAVPADSDSENHISEFRVSADPDIADASSERLLLRIAKPQATHNAGQLAFAPDGTLLIATGDGGGVGDADAGHTPGLGNAQDKSKLLGKILRIDVDSEEPYGIPPDNPLLDDPEARPEIWAYGLRNPFRFSIDAQPGGAMRVFAGDVGQSLREEVNLVTAGGNYGWRVREGSLCFDPDAILSPPDECAATGADGEPLIDPIIEYSHAVGTSVIGGAVYRGEALPELRGKYIFGDFTSGFLAADGLLFAATEQADGSWSTEQLAVQGRESGLGEYLYAFGVGPDDEMYILTNNVPSPRGDGGAVYRIVPAE